MHRAELTNSTITTGAAENTKPSAQRLRDKPADKNPRKKLRKTIMKKFILTTLMCTLGLNMAAPQKEAHAGIILLLVGGISAVSQNNGALLGEPTAEVVAGVGAVAVVAGWMLSAHDSIFIDGSFTSAASVLLFLDADGSLPQDQFASAIQKKYPFIDNTETVSNLANKFQEKAKSALAQLTTRGDKVMISLTPDEVTSAAIDANLKPAQLAQVINDLGPTGSL